MRFFVDTNKAEGLGLYGSELLVYSALCCLCHKAPWSGSYRKIAEISRCGNKDCAQRSIQSLLSKGYISKNEQGYQIETKVSQNKTTMSQNETAVSQNETILRERSKENMNNNINNNNTIGGDNIVKGRNLPPNAVGEILVKEGIVPSEPKMANSLQLYLEVIDCGYLHPRKWLTEMQNYFDMKGRGIVNWKATIHYWLGKEEKWGKHKPVLSEEARIYLRGVLPMLPEKGAVRLMDVLVAFNLTEKRAVFEVEKGKYAGVIKWFNSLADTDRLEPIFAAYGREIIIR